ncbi:carbohydrate-binding protein [Actinoplanes sp. URMC 104]|uniref:carbohydrate-binding protein n=1 Tax=Actinoplanes sp. URMC 104 TaxID=3423409 RepID=UPI003F52E2AA
MAAPPSAEATPSDEPVRTTAPPAPVVYPRIEAEAAAALTGVQVQDTEDEGGGQNVGWIAPGDSLRFDGVDFGAAPPAQLEVRVASDQSNGGQVEIRVDAVDAPPIGTFSVTSTHGWQSWRTDVVDLKPVTGRHTVFLTFARPDGSEFVNLNWLHLTG